MKIKNIVLFGVAAMALTACDDLFEPALENNQDISNMATDPTFARGILDNAYLLLPYDALPTSDLATDDAVSNQSGNDYREMATGAWASDMNPVSRWDAGYHAIQYCNLFIENCDIVPWAYSSVALNTMFSDNYKGNAYALRGLHLFHILRAHAGRVNGELTGVPIHLAAEDGSSDFNHSRNTFKECIDQIMADFDEALKYLPETYGDIEGSGQIPEKYAQMGATDGEYNRAFGSHHRGKIDGVSIAAFKAQVALFAASPAYAESGSATYEEAAKYAAECLKSMGGVANMDATGWKWFNETDYLDDFNARADERAEVIWRATINKDYSAWEEDCYPPTLYGNGRVNPTQNLVDAFPMASGYPITHAKAGYSDQYPYSDRDPRLKEYILVNGEIYGAEKKEINTTADGTTLDALNHENGKSTRTGYYMRKLLRSDRNLNPAANKNHLQLRIRSTEIFLIYAEAANEFAGPTAKVGGADYSAYDVIKAIRHRAGIGVDSDNDGVVDSDPYLEECKNDKQKMAELIRNERRLELCFENHRFWDLRRWKLDITEPARGVAITTDPITGALKYDYKSVEYGVYPVETRDYKDYMYFCPIPYTEVLKWSNLLQNDGWK